MGRIKDWVRASGIGRVPDYLGGAITRASGTALVFATVFILTGMSPGQFLTYLWDSPPAWLMSGWTRVFLVILGLVTIYGALRVNVWSQQQRAINAIAEDISWAIHHLLNRPFIDGQQYVDQWHHDYAAWCTRISEKLSNRAFFTLADQLHFDRLGFIDPVHMTGHVEYDWLLGQLRLKFERARDIINWVQQRRR